MEDRDRDTEVVRAILEPFNETLTPDVALELTKFITYHEVGAGEDEGRGVVKCEPECLRRAKRAHAGW